MSSVDKYKAIKEGTYNDPTNPTGKYNYSFSQSAEQQVGEQLASMIPQDEESWDTEDSLMTARMFIDGMWLNKGEEIASWISAGTYKLFGMYGSEGKSVSEIRDEMLQRAESQQARFLEERPVAGTVSNIAGSIASPASVLGGQYLARARDVRQAALAREAGEQVATTLGSRAISTAGVSDDSLRLAQQLSGFSPRAFNIASRTPTAVLGAGLAAGESAIIGAEGDTLQEKLTNAGISAFLGGTFSAGLTGIGMGVNKALQSNVAQQLGKGKDFVSLAFTDHMLAPVYRHVVSKAFGAKSLMEQQARNITARIPNLDALKQRGEDLLKNAQIRLEQSKRIITSERDEAIERARLLSDDIKDDLTASGRIKDIELDEVSSSRIDGLKNTRDLELDNIKANAVKEADEAVNALESAFRSKVFANSLPAAARPTLFDDIQTLSPQDALKELDTAWKTFGFQKSKNARIRVSSDAITKEISKIIEKAPERTILEGPQGINIAARVNAYVGEVLNKALDGERSGFVSGQTLVDMRSNIGRLLNTFSEDRSTVKEIVDPIQTYIDDLILRRLTSKKARNEFIEDREIWRVKSTLEDAANIAVKKQSAFSADDWISANSRQSKRLATRGKGIYQDEAQKIKNIAAQRDEQIKSVALDTSKTIKKNVDKAISEEKSRLSRAKVDTAKQLRKEKADAAKKYRDSRKTANDKAELDIKLAEAKTKYDNNLSEIQSQIEKISASEKVVKEAVQAVSREPTIFESLFANSLLLSSIGAGIVTGGGFGAGIAVSGAGLARGLASENFQRMLAGQTGFQQVGSRMADRFADSANKLAQRYGISAPQIIAPSGVALGEELGVVDGKPKLVFSKAAKEAIRNSPFDRKAQVYSGLLKSNRVDLVKSQDPAFFRELKAAYDRSFQ